MSKRSTSPISTAKIILSVDAVKYPLTGIGRYAYELSRHLSDVDDIDELLFMRGSKISSVKPEALSDSGGNVSRSMNVRRQVLKSRVAVSLYRQISTWKQRRALRDYEDYIFHGPGFYLPPFPGKSVVTVHDLSPFTWSHCHPAERVRYMHAEIKLSLKRASMLITDSEYTRKEVAEYFSWPMDRIKAVPLASGDEFRPRDYDDISPLLTEYGLAPNAYTLFVSTIEPRKNIITLLDAYERLAEAVRRRYPLILIGHPGWKSEPIHLRIQKAEREGWARYLGFVLTEHLPIFYSGARLFAFPSYYEGFGLPVLEAMASGVPVVCSNSSSLPEVAQDAAALCEPADTEQLTELLAMGLEDNIWRANAREKGLKRAESFSWKRCAFETAEVYRGMIVGS